MLVERRVESERALGERLERSERIVGERPERCVDAVVVRWRGASRFWPGEMASELWVGSRSMLTIELFLRSLVEPKLTRSP
jgi:hypothetical protein